MHATVRVESIAAGGAGVSRVDGLVVFTPRTAPGDLADIRYTTRDRLAHGRLVRIVEPSPARVTPRCGHFDGNRCGGCQLQHLSGAAQREAKRRIVADAMARIAKRPVEVAPVIPSPSDWEYRNKLTLAMRWRGGEWRAGLHQWDDVDRVFALRECPITHPRVLDGWRAVLRAADALPRQAELRGAVRLVDDTLAFILEGVARWPQARDFAERTPELAIVRWIDSQGRAHDVRDVDAERPAASFGQVNPAMAARLHADVVEAVLATGARAVVDCYAGDGATALPLAEAGVRVTAIELDREASAHAARRLPRGSLAVCARVEDALPLHLPADVVILNPPRAGVDARVCAALEDARGPRAPHVVYVSCNPATLARDLARLPSFRVLRVQPYDMFPQTAHVETLCVLTPEDRA